jgi:hypothetical protein
MRRWSVSSQAERVAELRREKRHEFDAMVAEQVLEWDRMPKSWRARSLYDGARYYTRRTPRFSWCAEDDYMVLRHVRERWKDVRAADFAWCCVQIWGGRTRAGGSWARYEPGDYAAAALTVVLSAAGAEVRR